jgi:TolB-like protein
MENIISKALEKDRSLRYQSAADIRSDLARLKRDFDSATAVRANPLLPSPSRRALLVASLLGVLILLAAVFYWSRWSGPVNPIDSIAVMPFTNAGGDSETEYLSGGLAESLINSLSSLRRLRVVPRSTVFRYKGQDMDPQTLGRDLNVRAVLVGRVVQRGDELLIGAELVDVQEQSQLWGDQYNRRMTDILEVQADITREISEKLRLQLTGEEQQSLQKAYPKNTEAYRLYLKGLYHRQKTTEAGFNESLRYFQQAIAEDPAYPLAYAGLSDTYNSLGYLRIRAPQDVWPKSKAAAEVSGRMPLALQQLGVAYARAGRKRDAERVIAELERKPYAPSLYIARIHMTLGNRDEVFKWWEQAYEERASEFINIRNSAEPWRSESHLQNLLRRAGVPPIQ